MVLPLPGTSVQENEAKIASFFLGDKITEVRLPFPLSRFSIPPLRENSRNVLVQGRFAPGFRSFPNRNFANSEVDRHLSNPQSGHFSPPAGVSLLVPPAAQGRRGAQPHPGTRAGQSDPQVWRLSPRRRPSSPASSCPHPRSSSAPGLSTRPYLLVWSREVLNHLGLCFSPEKGRAFNKTKQTPMKRSLETLLSPMPRRRLRRARSTHLPALGAGAGSRCTHDPGARQRAPAQGQSTRGPSPVLLGIRTISKWAWEAEARKW